MWQFLWHRHYVVTLIVLFILSTGLGYVIISRINPTFVTPSVPMGKPTVAEPINSIKKIDQQTQWSQLLPADFPNYHYASFESITESDTGSAMAFVTNQPLDEARSFYEQELEKNGWQFQISAQTSNALHYSFSRNKIIGGITLVQNDIYETTKEGTPATQIKTADTLITVNFNKR